MLSALQVLLEETSLRYVLLFFATVLARRNVHANDGSYDPVAFKNCRDVQLRNVTIITCCCGSWYTHNTWFLVCLRSNPIVAEYLKNEKTLFLLVWYVIMKKLRGSPHISKCLVSKRGILWNEPNCYFHGYKTSLEAHRITLEILMTDVFSRHKWNADKHWHKCVGSTIAQ